MSRGFYSVAASVFADAGEDTKTPSSFGCVVLDRTARTYCLHSATSPNTALEAAGGVFLADSWRGLRGKLSSAAKDRVFFKRVRREITVDRETATHTLFVPRAEVEVDDIVELDWLPPHKFLGDPEPQPVP